MSSPLPPDNRPVLLFAGEGGLVGGTERQFRTLHLALAEENVPSLYVTIFPEKRQGTQENHLPSSHLTSLFTTRGLSRTARIAQYLAAPWVLRTLLRTHNPASIFAASPQTNLLAWFAAGRTFRPQLAWGARTSRDFTSLASRIPFLLGAKLSRTVPILVSNSHAGAQFYRRRGYAPRECRVVPNLIDTDEFSPRELAPHSFRKELGVPAHAPIVGIIARLDPVKDHETFLKAAARVSTAIPGATFVVVGPGGIDRIETLQDLARKLGVASKVVWLGARNDVPDILSAVNLVVLTSRAEGFPNVLAESLACGTPCVSTNVGDANEILGEGRYLPESGDDIGIAKEIIDMLTHAPPGKQALRSSIVSRFGRSAILPTLLKTLRVKYRDNLS